MGIRKARTIAEYAIRNYLEQNHVDTNWFSLEMDGNDAVLTDRMGDSIKLQYDRKTHEVTVL